MNWFKHVLISNIFLLACVPAFAVGASGVPGQIGFQGRVQVNGLDHDGAAEMRFAIHDGVSVLWSNDGSTDSNLIDNISDGTDEPTVAVSLTVSNGLYFVNLGESPMQPIPASVFATDETYLRIWFDDLSSGSELLAPDQRINAVAYALMAADVAPGVVGVDNLDSTSVDARYVNRTGDTLSGNLDLGGNNLENVSNISSPIGGADLTISASGDVTIFSPAEINLDAGVDTVNINTNLNISDDLAFTKNGTVAIDHTGASGGLDIQSINGTVTIEGMVFAESAGGTALTAPNGVTISVVDTAAGDGGSLSFSAGTTTENSDLAAGGDIAIQAGAGGGPGGDVAIGGGDSAGAGSGAAGGTVTISGGGSSGAAGSGGDVVVSGGDAEGAGGDIVIGGGDGLGAGSSSNGGDIILSPGAALGGGMPGAVQINADHVEVVQTSVPVFTIDVGGDVSVLSTTASTDSTTGALVVSGGAGIAGDLFVGGMIHFSGGLSLDGALDANGNNITNVVTISGTVDNPLSLQTGAGQHVFVQSQDESVFIMGGADSGDTVLLQANQIAFDAVDSTDPIISANGELHVTRTDAFDSQINDVLKLQHFASDFSGASGIGTGVSFWASNHIGQGLKIAQVSGLLTGDLAGGEESGHLVFETGNNGGTSEGMRLDNQGNLGVGTADPIARFNTVGSASLITIGNFSSTGTAVTGGTSLLNDVNVGDTITADAQTRLVVSVNSDNDLTVDEAFSPDLSNEPFLAVGQPSLRIGDSSNEPKLVVSGEGNSHFVGIHTATPRAELDVNGSIIASGNLILDGNITGGTGILTVAGAAFTDTTESTSDTTGAVTVAGGVGIEKNLNVGGSGTIAGSLGIGTAAPEELLDIVSNTDADIRLYTAEATNDDLSSLHFYFSRGTITVPTVVSTNDVVGKLDGLGYDGSDFQEAAAIRFLVDDTPSPGVVPGQIAFDTADSTGTPNRRMVIKSDGAVGIGTTGPNSILHVKTSIDEDLLRLESNFGDASLVLESSTGSNSARIRGTNGPTSTELAFVTDGDERVRIDDDGNVGIGTDNPAATLHLWGPGTNGAGAKIRLGDFGSDENPYIKEHESDPGTPEDTDILELGGQQGIHFVTENEGRPDVEILANGHLHVNGSSESTDSTTGAFVVTGGAGVGGNVSVGGTVSASAYTGNSPIIFEAPAGMEVVRISDNDGEVGIGTAAPDARLHVVVDNAVENDSTTVLKLTHSTNSEVNGQSDMGVKISLELENDSGDTFEGGAIDVVTDSAAAGAETTDMIFTTLNSGVEVDALIIGGNGNLDLAGGINLPQSFEADSNFVGTSGNFISFGHEGVSEDFLGYKNNIFYFQDSPTGSDSDGPDVVIGGRLAVGSDEVDPELTHELTVTSMLDTVDEVGILLEHPGGVVGELVVSGTIEVDPRFNIRTYGADLVVDTSILEGVTGGNVGIGTTSPSGFFHVDAGTATNDTDGSDIILKAQDGGNGVSPQIGGNIILNTGEGTNDAPDGNVGINTLGPPGRTLEIHSDSPGIRLNDYGSTKFDIEFDDGLFSIIDATLDETHLVIEPVTGNVGVGTTNPAARHHVVVDDFNNADTKIVQRLAHISSVSGGDDNIGVGLAFDVMDSAMEVEEVASISGVFSSAGDTFEAGDLEFRVRHDSVGLAIGMRLLSNKNLVVEGQVVSDGLDAGSGNITTTGTLDAGAATVTSLDAGSGTIQTTGSLDVTSGDIGGTLDVGGDITLDAAVNQSITHTGSGNLTIESTSGAVEIEGVTITQPATDTQLTADDNLVLKGADGSGVPAGGVTVAGGDSSDNAGGGVDIVGGTGATGGGGVGVRGGDAHPAATDVAGGDVHILGGQSTGTAEGGEVVLSTAPAGAVSGTSTNGSIERVRITSDGAVGIGTAAPVAVLDVTGGGDIHVGFTVDCVVPGQATIIGNTDLSAIRPGDILVLNAGDRFVITDVDDNTNVIQFVGTCMDFMAVPPVIRRNGLVVHDGFVGVGTDSPKGRLSVQTTGNVLGLLHTDGSVIMGTFVDSGRGEFGTVSTHDLSFFTNGATSNMTLKVSGNAGIGTTDPDTRLHVVAADTADSIVTNVLTVSHHIDAGPGANNIGAGILFELDNGADVPEHAAEIAGLFTNVTAGSEAGKLIFKTRDGGSGLIPQMQLDEFGDLFVNGQITSSGLTTGSSPITTTGSLTAGSATVDSLDAGSGTIETTGILNAGTTDLGVTTVLSLDAGSGTIQTTGILNAGTTDLGATIVDSLDAGSGTIETTGILNAGTTDLGTTTVLSLDAGSGAIMTTGSLDAGTTTLGGTSVTGLDISGSLIAGVTGTGTNGQVLASADSGTAVEWIDRVHADLAGLSADDHPHYFLGDGTEAFGGNLDMGSNNINSVLDIDIDGFIVDGNDENGNEGEFLSRTASGVDWVDVDHGSLVGLLDDDHTQYLLADGTRALSGDISLGGNALNNVSSVGRSSAGNLTVSSALGDVELEGLTISQGTGEITINPAADGDWINLGGADSTTADGGIVSIFGGTASGGGTNGGSVFIDGGEGLRGGDVTVVGGTGTASDGGDVLVGGGDGSGDNINGGGLNLNGGLGTGPGGFSGDVVIQTGSFLGTLASDPHQLDIRLTVSSDTGDVRIHSTSASGSSASGALVVEGGAGINGDVHVSGSVTAVGVDAGNGDITTTGRMTSEDATVTTLDVVTVQASGNITGVDGSFSGVLDVSGGIADVGDPGADITLTAQEAGSSSNSDGGDILLNPGSGDGAGSSGNVGIGTPAPEARLHVVATDLEDSLVTDILTLSHEIDGGLDGHDNIGTGLLFQASAQAADMENIARISGVLIDANDLAEKGDLVFETRDFGGGLVERARIKHSGDVGFGTSDPDTTLGFSDNVVHIAGGTAGAAPGIVIENNDGGPTNAKYFIHAHVDGSFAILNDNPSAGAGGTEPFFIDDDGNVGIGTTGPSGPLDVFGGTSSSGAGAPITLQAQNAQAASNANGGDIILTPGLGDGGGNSGKVRVTGFAPHIFLDDNETDANIFLNGGKLRLKPDATELIVADLDSGLVGIGNNITPLATLHVTGDVKVTQDITIDQEDDYTAPTVDLLSLVRRNSAGAGVVNQGVGINFNLEDQTGGVQEAGSIEFNFTDVSDVTPTSEMIITTKFGGSDVTAVVIDGDGTFNVQQNLSVSGLVDSNLDMNGNTISNVGTLAGRTGGFNLDLSAPGLHVRIASDTNALDMNGKQVINATSIGAATGNDLTLTSPASQDIVLNSSRDINLNTVVPGTINLNEDTNVTGLLQVTEDDAVTGATTNVLSLVHSVGGGGGADDIGAGLMFRAEDSGGTVEDAAQIVGSLSTATNGMESGQIDFLTRIGAGALTERVTITADGKLGVGTSGPGAELDVLTTEINTRGIISTQVSNGFEGGAFTGRKAQGTVGDLDPVGAGEQIAIFQAEGYDGDSFEVGARITMGASENWDNSGRGADIQFRTTDVDTTSLVERMRITEDGDVGIGTNSPQSTFPSDVILHVKGGVASAPPGIVIENDEGGSTNGKYFINAGLNGSLEILNESRAFDAMFFDTDGRVAFGTTATSAKITSVGGVLLSGTASINSGETTVNGTGTSFDTEVFSGDTIVIGTDTFTVVTVSDEDTLTVTPAATVAASGSISKEFALLDIFTSDFSSALHIDRFGNVGVGTSSPTHTLDVDGTVRFRPVLITIDDDADNSVTQTVQVIATAAVIKVKNDDNFNEVIVDVLETGAEDGQILRIVVLPGGGSPGPAPLVIVQDTDGRVDLANDGDAFLDEFNVITLMFIDDEAGEPRWIEVSRASSPQ